MAINMTPKKENGGMSKKEVKEFLNAEHGSKDISKEQARKILNTDPLHAAM